MYELKLIDDNVRGGKGNRYYQVIDYDMDTEKLQAFVDDLNSKANFWIHWYVFNSANGILEETVDPLD